MSVEASPESLYTKAIQVAVHFWHQSSYYCCTEAQLSAILLAEQSQASAPVVTSYPASPWSNASAIFGAAGHGSGGNSLPSEVLLTPRTHEDLQQAAGQMQQLLMAGHRLEALKQVLLTSA